MNMNLEHGTLEEAFPIVNPGIEPVGARVLVQIRGASGKKITTGGVHIPDEALETEKWNTQTGKVVAVGPLAYKRNTDLSDWPEGAWCKVGDFVRVPKYGGDKWEVDRGPGQEPALFVMFTCTDIIGVVTGDPLKIKAFV